ncbi:amino acid permease [Marinococcus halophilus]|uniref:amino acid permease n=1 Tax=Marinococcus halophilus TaxID=1371 RepID=UPI001FD0138F|nr:amino acid permease [Marinococcus halophilus]
MRAIDLPQAIALYMAAVLGSGILFLTGSTAAVAGPASLVAWMIIIGTSLPIAYTFAILAKRYPDAGGVSTFVQRAFHRELGGMVGWMYFFCATSG